jgi:hypothetical protein
MVVVVVGAAAVLVVRARDSDSDDELGVLDTAAAEPATVDFHDVHLVGRPEQGPVAVGDVLVSDAMSVEASEPIDERLSGVTYSTDLGATWQPAELPGLPPVGGEMSGMTDFFLHRLDDAVAVDIAYSSGWMAEPALYLWVSTDGLEWRGGALSMLDLEEQPVGVNDVWRDEEGRLFASVRDGSDTPRFVIRSDDDGATWEIVDCAWPPPTRAPGCRQVQRAGRLWVSPDKTAVSLDEGRTWVEPELPGIELDGDDNFDPVQRSDGGWLAVASEVEHAESEYERTTQNFLLRSDDGIRWERVFYHDTRCSDHLPFEWISTPVPFGRGWVVAHVCGTPVEDASDGPLSQLLVLSADGRQVTPIAHTLESETLYGQPILVGGDTVVVSFSDTFSEATSLRELAAA